MENALRKFLASVGVGLLLVLAWLVVSIVVAKMGQQSVEQTTGAPPPPVEDFYSADLFRAVAPYLFIAGFFGTLLEPNKRRR